MPTEKFVEGDDSSDFPSVEEARERLLGLFRGNPAAVVIKNSERVCVDCKNLYPLTEEYFFRVRHKRRGEWFRRRCRTCDRAHESERMRRYRLKTNYKEKPSDRKKRWRMIGDNNEKDKKYKHDYSISPLGKMTKRLNYLKHRMNSIKIEMNDLKEKIESIKYKNTLKRIRCENEDMLRKTGRMG